MRIKYIKFSYFNSLPTYCFFPKWSTYINTENNGEVLIIHFSDTNNIFLLVVLAVFIF